MKKKLLILVCFVFAIGTYATVTGVQNSILIQNVLAFDKSEETSIQQMSSRCHYRKVSATSSTLDCRGDGRLCCAYSTDNSEEASI